VLPLRILTSAFSLDNTTKVNEFPDIINTLEIDQLITASKSYVKMKTEKYEALNALSAQVAHDIRSPLAALNTCLQLLPYVPEKQRVLMRNAADRINDIANNLLQQYKVSITEKNNSKKICLLATLVER
jgi:signal transduction histidine kinase